MPKERVHLLLADQSLRLLNARLGPVLSNRDQVFAYLLGSISPDTLFYDLPLNRLSSLGKAFHSLEGETCLPLLVSFLRESNTTKDPVTAGWILGVASHFIADGLWHPIIRKMSDPGTLLCREFKLSRSQCHHWLESELEGYWLARVGPPGGYLPILRQYRKRTGIRESCIECFRMVLMRLGLDWIPDRRRIGSCFFWQAALLHLFSVEALSGWRKPLLHSRLGRPVGALLVPPKSTASPSIKINRDAALPFEDLFDDAFIARSVNSLTEHLHELLLKL